MNKIKIVYIVPSLMQSGPINVLYPLVKHLNKDFFDPVICSLHPSRIPSLDIHEDFESLGVEVYNYSYSLFDLQFRLGKIAKELQSKFLDYDIIFHAHCYYPILLLSKFSNRLTMSTIHEISDLSFAHSHGQMLGRYFSYMYKKAFKKLSINVFISDSMSDYYGSNASLKFKTIYNGIENEYNTYSADEKKAIRKKLGLNDLNTKIFIFPAGFNFIKNHVYLIKTIKKIDRKDFVILFAGQGETEERCKYLVGSDNRFKFLGFCKNLSPFWSIADFLISPSLSEGMPLAVLEALIRGIPTILSAIPPHIEILNHVFNSSNLSFSTNDENSLIDLFLKVLDQKFDGDEIRNKTNIYYSAEAMCKSYENIYKQLVFS